MAVVSLTEKYQNRTKFQNDLGILKDSSVKSFRPCFSDLLHKDT